MFTLRIRALCWLLAGFLLAAVSVWATSAWRADALDPAESSVVTVDPERVLDTRDPNNLGLAGPFASMTPQKLQITGSVPTANGTKTVVPDGATGVVLTVTPVNATADGFISVEPGTATGQPTTSNVNFVAGAINPNSVTVALPTTGADKGKIRITYDAFGIVGPTSDILVDVVGYTTNKGLLELQGRLDTQLGRMDADITMGHGPHLLVPNDWTAPAVRRAADSTEVGGTGYVMAPVTGPTFNLGQPYALKSMKYCIQAVNPGATIASTQIWAYKPGDSAGTVVASDNTVRTVNGCYRVTPSDTKGYEAYTILWQIGTPNATITLRFQGFETVWAREATLPRGETPTLDPGSGLDSGTGT